MISRQSTRAAGLLLAVMTLWSVTAYASLQVCPVHDAPETAEYSTHGATDEHGPADEHGDHDCLCACQCCPASGETVSPGGSAFTLALLTAGLVAAQDDYQQPSLASHPWLFPPANGPPAV
jgi:hypothetical protein